MAVKTMEERLSELEKKVDRLLTEKESSNSQPEPWWKQHVGAFENSPYYDEAMRLGAEYRRSQPTPCDEEESLVPPGH